MVTYLLPRPQTIPLAPYALRRGEIPRYARNDRGVLRNDIRGPVIPAKAGIHRGWGGVRPLREAQKDRRQGRERAEGCERGMHGWGVWAANNWQTIPLAPLRSAKGEIERSPKNRHKSGGCFRSRLLSEPVEPRV